MILLAFLFPRGKGQLKPILNVSVGLIIIIYISFKDSHATSIKKKGNKATGRKYPVPAFPETNRIRRSAKYTQETLAIGKESYLNIIAYQARKGRSSSKSAPLKSKHEACNRQSISCDGAFPYRRIDGKCNNLKHIDWGSAFSRFVRLVPAAYADGLASIFFIYFLKIGFNAPRGQPPSKALPSPRLISSTVHRDLISPDPSLTNMVPQIGQFLDHDLTLSPEGDRRCCTSEKTGIDCWPIPIPGDDHFYSKISQPQSCMDFTRSTAFCFPGSSAIREQFNINTGFVDGSHIYGSSDERARYIREFKDGKLLKNSDHTINMPPYITQVSEVQGKTVEVEFMGKLMGGDDRVNETPGLTIMHTLWLQEHNRLANEIAKAKSDWDDEKIYQEARRIVVAQWQNIVFGHFLPIVLGEKTMKKWKLDLGSGDTFSDYQAKLNPSILHAFASAAFRFGHTLTNGLFRLFQGETETGSYRLRNTFFNSSHIETPGAYDATLAGLMVQNAQTYDRFLTEDITNFLFKLKTEEFGADLMSRNIQRGRDHGISPYDTYRQICGLPPLTTWTDKPPEINSDSWEKLKEAYDLPTDIDLFTGGITEIANTADGGGITGHTFNCLKAKQFYNTKFGDRFFFTHQKQAGSFTKKQLKIIRKRTLGDVICENSKIEKTPENVFKIISNKNPWTSCKDSSRTKIQVEDFTD